MISNLFLKKILFICKYFSSVSIILSACCKHKRSCFELLQIRSLWVITSDLSNEILCDFSSASFIEGKRLSRFFNIYCNSWAYCSESVGKKGSHFSMTFLRSCTPGEGILNNKYFFLSSNSCIYSEMLISSFVWKILFACSKIFMSIKIRE